MKQFIVIGVRKWTGQVVEPTYTLVLQGANGVVDIPVGEKFLNNAMESCGIGGTNFNLLLSARISVKDIVNRKRGGSQVITEDHPLIELGAKAGMKVEREGKEVVLKEGAEVKVGDVYLYQDLGAEGDDKWKFVGAPTVFVGSELQEKMMRFPQAFSSPSATQFSAAPVDAPSYDSLTQQVEQELNS